jgi:hypothetical protein
MNRALNTSAAAPATRTAPTITAISSPVFCLARDVGGVVSIRARGTVASVLTGGIVSGGGADGGGRESSLGALSSDGADGSAPPADIPRMSAAVGGAPTAARGGALEGVPRRAPAFNVSSEKSTELSLRAPVGFSS